MTSTIALRVGTLAISLTACVGGEGIEQNEMSAATRPCPEAVRYNDRRDPIGVESGRVRFCWPGEPNCFCDRDGDCYPMKGYVACVPPRPDAGATDASAVTDASMGARDAGAATDAAMSARDAGVGSPVDAGARDAAADVVRDAGVTDAGAASRVCPEAVTVSARGNPVGAVSGHIRFCWPGEAHCYCDRDNDCYAQEGYVPCTPPATTARDAGATDAGARDSGATVVDAGARDSGSAPVDVPTTTPTTGTPLPADTVRYTGAFSGASGYYRARLTVMGEARDVWVYAPASRGANPPLLIAFHGTNGDGDVIINESNARALADAQGVVVVAPTARWFGGEGADYDHPGGNGTYWETRNANVDTNADLVLTRAAIVEAQRAYRTDPDRVYVMGHSNGGFMSLLVSVALRDRIAAFAENSSGMVTCATRPVCSFQGSASTCAGLAGQGGWCSCSGGGQPAAPPATGRHVPGYLSHGAQDPMVSVFYTCALAARMSAVGAPVQTTIWSGGHDLPRSFLTNAWAFLSRYRRQ